MREWAARLAELAVGFGANVQLGQDVYLTAETGHLDGVRAVAEVAYARGARFVDVRWFDPYVQRSRIAYAAEETLGHVAEWELARQRQMGDDGAASIKLTGPTAPGALDALDPARVAQASIGPSGFGRIETLVNWTVVPWPTAGWAAALYPDKDPDAALAALWGDVAAVCRLDEPDPVAAWRTRLNELSGIGQRLTALRLDAVRLRGPGTDLTVGLLPGARWQASAEMISESGIASVPNLPTEEVFTIPDPARVDGHVRLTRPALVSGRLVTGVQLEFRAGELVCIDGDDGVDALRQFTARDAGARRLGELALVGNEGRVGQVGRAFGVILLDENAASHVALGYGLADCVEPADRGSINVSEHHLDVMVGSSAVQVTGIDRAGRQHLLLDEGAWTAPSRETTDLTL